MTDEGWEEVVELRNPLPTLGEDFEKQRRRELSRRGNGKYGARIKQMGVRLTGKWGQLGGGLIPETSVRIGEKGRSRYRLGPENGSHKRQNRKWRTLNHDLGPNRTGKKSIPNTLNRSVLWEIAGQLRKGFWSFDRRNDVSGRL